VNERAAILAARAAFVVAFASCVVGTLPRLRDLARTTRELWPLDQRTRHERLNGGPYLAKEIVDRTLPPSEAVALIVRDDMTPALFASYYVYPHPSRIYSGLVGYRNGDVRTRPKIMMEVTNESARFVKYEELRDQTYRGSRVMRGALAPAPARAFVLPIAASVDGPVIDSYVTEADFENASDANATLRFTLMPQRIAKTIAIAPRSTASFYDLVYQNFARTDLGWLRVESDQPIRAAAWLVNRGRNEGVSLPLVTGPRSGTIHCPGADCVLRLINLADHSSTAIVDGTPVPIAAGGWASMPVRNDVHVSGDDIFAFAGTRGGKTEIAWP